MTTEYSVLEVGHVNPEQSVASPVYLPKIIHLDDPAVEVMIDYHKTKPITADMEQPMFKTRQALEKESLHIALVYDEKQKIVGMLSLQQILSENTVKLIEANRVLRKEVLTRHVMTPLADVCFLTLAQLRHAKVGHIIATLEKLKKCYVVVMEEDSNTQVLHLRGIF
jgi:predicted transcriptional regulator